MMVSEKRTFVENPFDALKIAGITMILLILFVYIRNSGKGLDLNLILALLAISIVVLLFVALIVSFLKKRTIVCVLGGFEVYEINAWGNSAPTQRFRWNEVTDTNLRLVSGGKAGMQTNLEVSINEKQVTMLTLNWLKKKDFNDLMAIINQSTPHLPHELIEIKNAGKRQIIEEVRSYCKVARI